MKVMQVVQVVQVVQVGARLIPTLLRLFYGLAWFVFSIYIFIFADICS